MPIYTMTGPNGQLFQLEAEDNVPREKVEAELRKRIGEYLKSQPGVAASPMPAVPVTPAVPAQPVVAEEGPTPQQRYYQAQAIAQREAERGFFGRMYDEMVGNELPTPKAYTPKELAARQKAIREEQDKLTKQAAAYDKMAKEAATSGYQNPNAPDRALGFIQRAQAARDQAKALDREFETITKTGLEVPEAQTTRETIGAIPREFGAQLFGLPGVALELGGRGLAAASIPGGETLKEAGLAEQRSVRSGAESLFGAPGEALRYDAPSQFLADVGGGVGSLGTFLVPGAAAKLAGVGKGLEGAAKAEAIANVARPYEYGIGIGQGAQQGSQDIQDYEQRTGQQVSEGKAFLAMLLNAGLGATEVGVAGRIFERIPVAQRGVAIEAVANTIERATAGRVNPAVIGEVVTRTLSNIERSALGRVAVRGTEEALQEGGQQFGSNLIAQQLYDPNRDLMEGVGYNALIGGIVGGGLRGGVEVASAIRKGKAESTNKTPTADSPEVEQEYLRLVTTEAQALRDQNPDLTQRQAFNQVMKDAGKLYDTAIMNTLFGAEGGANATPDVGTAVDVSGRGGTGAAPDLEPAPAVAGTPDLGEAVTGRLGEPVSSVPVTDVGTRTGEPALTVGAAPTFDTTAIFEGKTKKDRTSAAMQVVSDIAIATPELQALPAKKYTQAATQMANIASRGEQFDPLDIMYKVAEVERPAPEVTTPEPPKVARDFRAAIKMEDGTVYAGEPGQTHFDVYEANPNLDYDKMAPEGDGFVDNSNKFYTRKEAAATLGRTGKYNELYVEDFDATEEELSPPAEKTLNDLAGAGTVNPDNTNEVLVEGGGVQLTPVSPNIVQLDSLRAVERGGGRKAMQQLIKVADDNGTAIQLSPEPFAAPAGKEMTPTELSDWYAGFGFEAQPDGTMVRPASAPSTTITPEPVPTPQQIVQDIERFARSEAEDRGFDPGMFGEGARDAARGVEPLPDNLILEGQSQDALDAYKAGMEFGRERLAEAQAAPAAPVSVAPATPEAAAPPGAPPIPPTAPPATGGPSGPAPRKPKVVSNGKPVVLTAAQTRTALEKAKTYREKMNRIQKRIAATNDTADVLSDGIDLVKLARGDTENWALLRGAIDTLDVGKWQMILPTLSTEDIFRILKGRISGLTEADRIIRQDITRFQTKEYLQLAEQLEEVAAFLKKYPKAAQALSDLEFATVAYQVDPTKAPTAEEYFAKVDGKAKEIRAKIKAEKDTKKKGRLEANLKQRFEDIESVYKGVPGDERVAGWRDLSRSEMGGGKGREIFKLLRDAHRRDLEAKYEALRSRLMETKEDEALDEALEKLEEQFKPARDQVIYFPAMRYGSYYARVGSGANSIFKMFESRLKRDQFVRVMKKRGEEITETGNVEDLRNQFEKVTGGPLKEVLDLFEGDQKDLGALRSQVFDLWLQTMSAGDMRKHMAPRKMRAGYSTDILKNFANFRRSSINDVKRAKYGYKLRTEISRAKDSLEGASDREKMNVFVKEIELRTLGSLMPEDRSNPYLEAAIQLGNKAAFYQYLANPKTAVIQLTQLHIVALPMLAQKYGSVKATAALSKYGFSSLGGFVASPLKAIKREGGGFTFDWEQPNLLDNPISALKEESNPELYEVLSEGWNEGRDLNLYMDTFANQIGGYGAADPQQRSALQELMRGRVHTAAWRGTTFALEAMGTLMHQMERVNREATYMAALELGYRENKKNGQSHEEAKKNAIEAAVETTLAATFDFSSYNKPRVLTTGAGRLAGQFMSYPYFMTSLLARNLYTAIKFGGLEPGERLAAAQTATGALVNIGLYAGLTGLPLYGIFKVIGSLLAWLFDDDDEEGGLSYIDENGNIKATYNVDWWFRNVWIPKFFGPDGTVANLFGLDDDTAELLARSVEKGPISAITDVDLSNSVALDFLFFVPRESRADTPEGQLKDYTFSAVTGAFGNTVMDYFKAGKDLMNGYTSRALERTPRLFGNIAKANRFAEEGQLNYNRELVGMDKDFWTSDKAIFQALGFASTEADQKQQQNYEAKAIKADVKKARDDMISKYRKVALDIYQYGYTPEVAAERQKVMEEWLKFNKTYPTDVIGVDTLYEVQLNAVTDARRSHVTRGVPMDATGKTPYLRDIYARRVREDIESSK